ncbi:MAG TPA: hypothetical protein VJ482_12000 [Acidimicrobiia bacterium]|nr:hypothetical protein [Acidimicrobiia bacterium]
MNPYAMQIIAETKMKELREEAALHRLAAQARMQRPGRFRTTASRLLISMGERLLPNPSPALSNSIVNSIVESR